MASVTRRNPDLTGLRYGGFGHVNPLKKAVFGCIQRKNREDSSTSITWLEITKPRKTCRRKPFRRRHRKRYPSSATGNSNQRVVKRGDLRSVRIVHRFQFLPHRCSPRLDQSGYSLRMAISSGKSKLFTRELSARLQRTPRSPRGENGEKNRSSQYSIPP